MWHTPESVMLDLSARAAKRESIAKDMSIQYAAMDLKAGYKGRRGDWKGVVKFNDSVVFTCDCSHHNRNHSTCVGGASATDCARDLIFMCLSRQFNCDNGKPSWSIDNAKAKYKED